MKKTITILLLLILAASIKAPSSSAKWDTNFYDVSLNNSHYSNIHYLADLGIIKGYSDYTFKPSNYVTNRQVAVMLVRALNLENEEYSDPGFKDVTKKDSAYKEIAIATQKGFFSKSVNFKPNEYITRESMAHALTKAFNLKGTSTMTFSDVPNNHSAYLSVQALAANNITTGNNGKFNPKNKLTRAQFASFLTRTILPEARPSNKTYEYNSGLVPTKYGSTYIYSEYYEMESNLHVFDSVYDHSRFIENSRTTIMDGSHSETETFSRIEYYEDLTRYNISVRMPYTGAELELKYPIKDGKEYTKIGRDQYGNDVKWDYTVHTTNGIHKIDNEIYTDVIIVEELKYFDDGYPMHTTYYLVKDIGLIAFDTEVGSFELVSLIVDDETQNSNNSSDKPIQSNIKIETVESINEDNLIVYLSESKLIGADDYNIYIDGKKIFNTPLVGEKPTNMSKITLGERFYGEHEIRVELVDQYDNYKLLATHTQTLQFKKDNDKPKIEDITFVKGTLGLMYMKIMFNEDISIPDSLHNIDVSYVNKKLYGSEYITSTTGGYNTYQSSSLIEIIDSIYYPFTSDTNVLPVEFSIKGKENALVVDNYGNMGPKELHIKFNGTSLNNIIYEVEEVY